MSANAVYAPLPGTEASRLGGDFVVLDAAGRTLRGLNPTGARVFELLDGKRAVREIAAEIAREHHAPEDRVLADVTRFLGLLASRGLVREQDREVQR